MQKPVSTFLQHALDSLVVARFMKKTGFHFFAACSGTGSDQTGISGRIRFARTYSDKFALPPAKHPGTFLGLLPESEMNVTGIIK